MPQLKTLYLMDNNLTFVPSWLGRCEGGAFFPFPVSLYSQHNAADASGSGSKPHSLAAARYLLSG
jgi:hypothetical protein